MRVVYLNPSGALGGAERSLLDVIAAVRQADAAIEPRLLALADGPLVEHARGLGVEVTVLPLPTALAALGDSGARGRLRLVVALALRGAAAGGAAWRFRTALERTLVDLDPDVIHSNGFKTHLFTRLARMPAVPVLWHLRDFVSARPLVGRLLRLASTRASGALAISQAVADDARRVLARLPIEVVYNAIDTTAFSPQRGDGRRLDDVAGLPPAPAGTLRVGLIATFARWKGHDLFLEAMADLARHPPERSVRGYIIGGPIYTTRGSQCSERELRDRAVSLGLQIGFVGFQVEPAWVYHALDIVVHASTLPEPFGRVIVEAMACGKPELVSRAGGAAELFTHGVDAVGFPPGNSHALASGVRELLADPDFCRRLGEQARRTAIARFARERLGHEVIAVYRRLHCEQASGERQLPVL